MAKYKVWLTVKDNYGNTKELDGGNIDINLNEEDVDTIIDNIKDNINLGAKSPVYVPEVTPDNMLKFKLTDEATEKELAFDIDKTNDWNPMDSTAGSSFVWEQITVPNPDANNPNDNSTNTSGPNPVWEPMQ